MPQDVQLPLGKVTLELQRGHLLNTEIAKPWYTKITSVSATSAILNDAFLLKNCTANIGKNDCGTKYRPSLVGGVELLEFQHLDFARLSVVHCIRFHDQAGGYGSHLSSKPNTIKARPATWQTTLARSERSCL